MSSRLAIVSVVLIALGGCVVEDADPPGAVLGLTLAPSAASLDVFHVQLTGQASFGYTSDAPAVLAIWVDGALVSQQSIGVSAALAAPIDLTVPVGDGPNEVVGTLTYQGESMTQRFTVTAAMTAPAITMPTWTSTYTAHVGMTTTGRVQVVANPAYAVREVAVAIDGGPWLPTTAAAGGWDAAIVDPDLGDSDVAVRVTTTVDGHAQDTVTHGVIHVDPVFACAQPSMLPDTRLTQNVRTEVRTMVGYFGRPGGHAITFQLGANVSSLPGSPRINTDSQLVSAGTASVVASFVIDVYRCDTGNPTCDLPYDLTLWVDGVAQPTCANFGVVRRYN